MDLLSPIVSYSTIIPIYLLILLKLHVAFSVVIVGLRNQNKQQQQQPHHRRPVLQANQSSCALFMGTWVPDETYPFYQPSACPVIEAQFNCLGYGRPDTNFLKYRWTPANCELPRFDGAEFLSKMRGKSVMFVGDSLGRNQWESLICMILAGVSRSETQMNRALPLSTFKFLEYGVTLSYYKAPYLVDIDAVQGKRVLKLDDIRGNGNAWRDVDVLYFNTGHWWSHKGSLQGWDYMESGGSMYQDMDRLVAMEIGLRTWSRWMDSNIDSSRTRVFFQTISPTHSDCYGVTAPTTTGATYAGESQDQMRVVEEVLKDMNYPPYLMDITLLSAMRRDAHPSIYSGDLTPEQRANPDHSADCSHWCLPGLPDTWNQLFYTSMFF